MITQTPERVPDDELDLDLTRFETLTDDERVRVIIRVLCGLVALEEAGGGEVAPPRRRLLPFLGFEGRQALSAEGRIGRTGGRLPFLGVDATIVGGLGR